MPFPEYLYVALSHEEFSRDQYAPMTAIATTDLTMVDSIAAVMPQIDPPQYFMGLVVISLN